MPPDQKSGLRFEIGHVLFIDIVGYSKGLISEQSESLQKLKEIVRGTEQFRLAEAEGKLLRLPTGDGGALVFRNTPEAPALCALEISQALKSHPELRVRMGIHSGPVNEVEDLNDRANIAGAGINIAQRVMDCGDAGHILLSKRVADDLEQYPQWRPHLHELGRMRSEARCPPSVVNLYTDEVGNPAVPEKLRQTKEDASTGGDSATRDKTGSTVTRDDRWADHRCGCRCRGPLHFLTSARPEGAAVHRRAGTTYDSGKIDRCSSLRKPERRESKQLLCRRHSERDSDALIEDRRPEGHLADLDRALQERAGKPA